jgi:hypothetical protein
MLVLGPHGFLNRIHDNAQSMWILHRKMVEEAEIVSSGKLRK